ncbi:hypothetical protein DCC62_15185 [candidate division KSB1 bacterium]|nr:MAG: hypothetical protein DCC62_15185 [candidate division KSB1 bacterium]
MSKPASFSAILFIVCYSVAAFAQESESTTAPKINTFSLTPDARGALGNSVNLFTGDVALPLNLVTLPGRNGLDVGVNISYSSNIQNQVDTWNVEAPSGVLGVGWSFDFEKIIVDHKNTGSRFDDDFYLIAGGSSNLMIRTGTATDGAYEYETKNYQRWKILCYTGDERWEITRENGMKHVYGGGIDFDGNGQRTSQGNSVQWGVKWGNWIGSSNVTTGQSQFAVAWNLSKIQNTWGESVTFTYDIAEQYVGSTSGKKHTTASYLKTITDVFGRTVKFYYQDKSYGPTGPREYQAAHNEHGNTGVYQDKFETRFLDYIAVFDIGGTDTLSTTRFAYHPLQYLNGNYDLAKRYLKSITQYVAGHKAAPALVFDYYFTSSDPRYGALKSITYPEGGIATYDYASQTIAKSSRNLTISAPAGYAKPRVWIAEDYVVVTWFHDSGIVKVYAYQWDGRWVPSGEIGSFSGVYIVDSKQNFELFVERDFFVLLEKYYDNSDTKVFHLFHKNQNKPGAWFWHNHSNYLGSEPQQAAVSIGRNFAATLSKNSVHLHRYRWNQNSSTWEVIGWEDLNPSIYAVNNGSMAGANNYFVVSYLVNSNPDELRWFYLNEFGEWQDVIVGFPLNFFAENINFWHAGAQFAFALNDNEQHIYRWDEYFSENQFVKNFFNGVNDGSKVGIFESTVSISGTGTVKGMRWNGANWIEQIFTSNAYTSSAAGNDFIIRRDKNAGTITRYVFDPASNAWAQQDAVSGLNQPYPVDVTGESYSWYTNSGTSPQAKLYSRIPTNSNGWSDATAISSWGSNDARLRIGNDFYTYEDWNGGNPVGTKVGLRKNNVWDTSPDDLDDFKLPGTDTHHFTNTIVTRNGAIWDATSQINLYRVLNDGHTGPLTDLAVSSISINDGYDVITTNFAYDASRAVYDPSGSVAQYNEVKVTAGTGANGYIKHYFFNSLSADDLLVDYPPNDAFTNAEDFLSLVKGLEYKTQVYNSSDVLVSSTTKYWKAVSEQLRATDEGVYIRLMKETSTLDGVEKIVENTYNSLGLATETKTYNHNWEGAPDTHTQTFKYWYEAYDTDLSENFFTPVIQTTTKTNATTTSVSATAWKEWYTGKWAPHKSYQWSGSGGSNFDFSSWSGSGEPSSGWLKTSEIVAVNAEGAVLQSKNLDGVHQSTLYDYPKLRPIAGFTHARISQTALGSEAGFLGFETGNTTSSAVENDYWSFPPNPISISTNAHTGRYSCSLDADNNSSAPVYGPTRDFRPPDSDGQQRKYILSCWVRTQPGFGAGKGQLIIHSKQDSDSDNTVYPNVAGALIALSFGDTQGQWQYLEAVLDLKQVHDAGPNPIPYTVLLRLRCFPVNYDDTHFLLVDDLRLSPVDAPFSATVYDPQYDFAIAALGTNGETMRTIYDSRQRPLATVGPNENVSSLTLPYYSREGNNDAFNASDPNSSLSLSARNGGIYDGFDDGNHTGWDVSNGNWTVTPDKKLKNTGVDGSDYAVLQNFSASNFGVAAKVEKISGNDFGLQIGNVLVRWVNKWQIKDGAEVLAEDIATPLSDNWLLLASNKTVFFFAGGKLVFTEIRPAAVSSQLKLFTGAAGTQVTFDDILVLRDPVIARNFLDGAGKARQSRTFNGLMSQISETVYDAIGRPAVQTKTAEFFNSPLSFRPDFVDNMNWVLGDMTGGVANYYSSSGNGYSDDEGFPYSRQVYENSPLGRVKETGLPGLTFAVGRSHTALASYSKNNNENFYGAFPAGSFPLGQYFETIDISPDGVWTITWTDKAGNVMVTSTGPNESGINPTTSYQYDDFGNVVQINPPNYHNPPASSVANDWPIVMSYDFFGRLKQKTTPDAQATYFYIYDKGGRMRFMMDANGGAQNPDHIQYWKYDALGRAIECGYLVQDWNATILQNYADTDPAWPSTPATWRKKYTYDYNGTTPYLKGRLYKVESNNDGDTAAEVEETFAYDIYGNVMNKTAKVLDYSASSYDIAYEYDHAGNVTRITYIPENLLLQNETVAGTVSHSAANTITAGPGYTIAAGASAVLQAGSQVVLKPGFTAAQGSYFNARIDPALTQEATVVTYAYDALGRLASVGTPGDADFYASYTYHADGRLDEEKLANGAEIRDHFYNSPGWLLRIDGSRFKEDLTYNAGGWGGPDYYDGRIKTTSFMYNWAGKPADYAVQYTYDNLGQLTVAENDLNNAWNIGIGNPISYDPNGNILDLTRGSTATITAMTGMPMFTMPLPKASSTSTTTVSPSAPLPFT